MKAKSNKSAKSSSLPKLFSERRTAPKKQTRPKSRPRLKRILLIGTCAIIGLPLLIALMIRWIDPPYSMFMWQQSRALGQQKSIHQEWVDWEFISDELKIAVIAAEDQRFLEHSGFDWDAIAQTWQARQAGTSRGGASTISQQLAKNLFLWSGQSWIRKGIEAWLTVAIELIVPKQRILEIYLNIAQWGDAQFGAEAASEFFFAKSARELTRWEAALLAAVLPNPVIYRVNAPSRYVTERQRWIVRNVRRLGGPGYLSEL